MVSMFCLHIQGKKRPLYCLSSANSPHLPCQLSKCYQSFKSNFTGLHLYLEYMFPNLHQSRHVNFPTVLLPNAEHGGFHSPKRCILNRLPEGTWNHPFRSQENDIRPIGIVGISSFRISASGKKT